MGWSQLCVRASICRSSTPASAAAERSIRSKRSAGMKWLHDAAKLRINPQIPRKIAEDKKEVMDWQMATFQADYDPWKNPWLT